MRERFGDRGAESFSTTLPAMIEEMKAAPEAMQPSKFWQDLNRRHAERMASTGIANFKRTLAKDYFTWMRVLPWDPQIRFLIGHLPPAASLRAALGVMSPLKHRHIPLFEGFALNFLTRLVWQYAGQECPEEIAALSEPSVGNPPAIRIGGRLVSQDLANSILEYKSVEPVATGTICELGGGYGRTAFVIASLRPTVRYIMVDIPPALGVAQEYLCQVFADRSISAFVPSAILKPFATNSRRPRLPSYCLINLNFCRIPPSIFSSTSHRCTKCGSTRSSAICRKSTASFARRDIFT
ncbi:putative sugar O-methyltransferase [Mesorhizobium silamurunense]|uniref:putative sugar O-methyltransferase n=1 Tax=Mesorhizobium silamurunense TaxID=499528 RepID=UPI00177E7E45|nr:putative sugar O-methyltransferase [Mesorhizobium silamurunense]